MSASNLGSTWHLRREDTDLSELIYHLAEPDDWTSRSNAYQPGAFPEEGFIHCSTAGQLEKVRARHFPGRHDLVVLIIDTSGLGHQVVYEDLDDTGEEFPHVYGPIPLDAIVETRTLS